MFLRRMHSVFIKRESDYTPPSVRPPTHARVAKSPTTPVAAPLMAVTATTTTTTAIPAKVAAKHAEKKNNTTTDAAFRAQYLAQLHDWDREADRMYVLHRATNLRYETFRYWFGLAAAVLGAIATVVTGSMLAQEVSDYIAVRIIAVLISISAGVLTAIVGFSNFQTEAQKHKQLAAAYYALSTGIQYQYIAHVSEDRMRSYARYVYDELTRLSQNTEPIPAAITKAHARGELHVERTVLRAHTYMLRSFAGDDTRDVRRHHAARHRDATDAEPIDIRIDRSDSMQIDSMQRASMQIDLMHDSNSSGGHSVTASDSLTTASSSDSAIASATATSSDSDTISSSRMREASVESTCTFATAQSHLTTSSDEAHCATRTRAYSFDGSARRVHIHRVRDRRCSE